MTYVAGAWKVKCDRCGTTYLNNQLRKEWNGLRTCKGAGTNDCWEPRHPQELIKSKLDKQALPWARPEPPIHELTDEEQYTQADL